MFTATTRSRDDAKQSIRFRDKPTLRLQILRGHEAHTMALRVGLQNPCSFFHLVQTRMLAIDVIATGCDWKRDSVALIAECSALDDLVAQARAANDGGVPAGVAE
jgi:hypothetical protein